MITVSRDSDWFVFVADVWMVYLLLTLAIAIALSCAFMAGRWFQSRKPRRRHRRKGLLG